IVNEYILSGMLFDNKGTKHLFALPIYEFLLCLVDGC
ncbi:MAG: hypothetical protein ACI8RD_013666, partial [Bacillariaceae sp.]